MEKIEKLIWKNIDGTITQVEQEFLNAQPDQDAIKEMFVKIKSLNSNLQINSVLKSPAGLVSRVMSEIKHLSIIPKVNYNLILGIAIGFLSILTLVIYLIRNRFEESAGGRFDGLIVHLDFAAYDIGQHSLTPYLAIIPLLTILVWIDQSFSPQFRERLSS